MSCRDGAPSLYTVNSNIDPPDTRNAEDAPKIGFAKEAACWSPLDDEEPDGPGKVEERYAQAEEKLQQTVGSACRPVIEPQGTNIRNTPSDMGPRRNCSEAELWERKVRCQSLRKREVSTCS